MEEKIKEIQEYFVKKILAMDFNIVKWTEYVCSIRIDEKYDFNIWVASGGVSTKPSIIHEGYFMQLPFSEEQAIVLDEMLQPLFQKWKKETALKEAEDKYNRLKNELETL